MQDDLLGSPASVRRGVVGLCEVLGVDDPTVQRRLMSAAGRWLRRAGRVDPEVDLTNLGRLGGRLVVPGDREWPVQIDDLGDEAPFCLWARGTVRVDEALAGAVSIVGARASTDYGERIAAEMAAGLVDARRGTVSGGAYGIDAAVHRATLAVDGVTVAFLAGGVDRLYPAGNTALLRAVVDRGGLLLSEVPPGAVPSRVRFLRRNRLIAAAGRSTVVVEAAWRSGSLVTARLAAGLGRPVGAVPGPVTSAASAGSHRLMREGVAVCVTDVAEVLELTGAAGDGVAELAEQEARRDESGARPHDGLDDRATATLDALPVRRPATVEALARSSGLAPHEVMSALGVLELRGQAARSEAGWRRAGRGR
ncbi:DNA-processing protein DprA [Sanguibacter sp. 4.1]|uniref:DNA-processing protein DprA n=1 Tax=Sanguibacter biliveldensis TaxID=3030830 RepID=A0AAF0Z6N1_9MICO|nr:DNA-processing protein DprA [Sanguibacter sp. 4.1]WPF81058.1 DNA-processing protein DprA [Sanguibacter sp. 4.1]